MNSRSSPVRTEGTKKPLRTILVAAKKRWLVYLGGKSLERLNGLPYSGEADCKTSVRRKERFGAKCDGLIRLIGCRFGIKKSYGVKKTALLDRPVTITILWAVRRLIPLLFVLIFYRFGIRLADRY